MSKSKIVEIDRIPHCDHECCNLGQLIFDCPQCDKANITCDNWYKLEDFDALNFKCDYCSKKFTLKYNSELYEWYLNE